MRLFGLALLFMLAGCTGGAVVFAPTPLPADISPLRYMHPGGAFSVVVPRAWPVYEQNTTALASASFVPPGENEPVMTFAVMKPDSAVDTGAFAELINRYQQEVRPDAAPIRSRIGRRWATGAGG
jgi:hypothetical protein